MIRFEHVTKRYDDGTTAVDDLSFEVARGELVTLVGPSGCGKTTTMKMVNRLIEPTAGRILLDGDDVSAVDPVELRRRIGYVIQQVGLFPHRTVLDNTATVPHLLGVKRARARERAAELLDLVGLDPAVFGDRYPDQLSGGQRQRVAIARALAPGPEVLVCDEPVSALDASVQAQVLRLLDRLRRETGVALLFITHDLAVVREVTERVLIMRHGSVVEEGGTDTILTTPGHPYTRELVASVLRLPVRAPARDGAGQGAGEPPLSGPVPQPITPLRGNDV